MTNSLLERAHLLNQICDDTHVILRKDIIGQYNVLSTCQQPSHQINPMMDIAWRNIQAPFKVTKCRFFGPFFNQPCALDIAQHRFSITGFNQQFIIGCVGFEPSRRIHLEVCRFRPKREEIRGRNRQMKKPEIRNRPVFPDGSADCTP